VAGELKPAAAGSGCSVQDHDPTTFMPDEFGMACRIGLACSSSFYPASLSNQCPAFWPPLGMPESALSYFARTDMADADRIIRRYLTGRQSAHLKFTPRKPRATKNPDDAEPPPMPEVSVVSWEVREELCEPYVIKAVVSASEVISRKGLVGQFAKFTIQPEDERAERAFWGLVTKFESLTESRDGCTYRVVIRQRLAMLDGPSNCATYQHKSSPEIIQEVLKRNDVRFWLDVQMKLRREHPKHDFRFQFNIGDWQYIKLEMEQAGLFCYTLPSGRNRETLVIADDIDGYVHPAIPVLDRPSSGLATFEESIYAFQVAARTVPESFVVADYNRENAWQRLRGEGQVRGAEEDCTMVGRPYVWGTDHKDAAGAKREAELRHEAAYAHQVGYKAKSTVLAIRPGCVVAPDRSLEDSKWGMVVTRVVHRGARNESYRNTFRGIPANRAWRMAIDPSRWPRIHGTLPATICSPNEYRYAYLTDKGEYIARLHPDFGNWPKGGESIPLRLAKVYAGKDHTGLHIPAVDGDEAIVAFEGGDPNRPYIAGFHHNSQRPDLINSSRRRISRSELRTQSGNKFWMDDCERQQGVELSTEHSGRSQLHLGHIVDGDLKERGNGAELRTSGHWVGRGGSGVMLTAYDQPGGNGKVVDTTETRAQLDAHARLADALARSADASKASPADVDAQRAVSADLDEVKQPGVLVTAPGPVGIASGDGVQLAADGSIFATSKKGMHFSTLKRLTAAAGGVLSMFAQQGMKLIASAGELVIQAQRGPAQLAAQEGITVESVNGVVHVKSPKEIVLGVGGSYIHIKPDGIELGTRGSITHRSSRLSKTGPAQMDLGGQAFAPVLVPFTTDCEVWRTRPDFVEEIAAAPEPAQWESFANTGAIAPSPLGDFFSRQFGSAVPPGSSAYSPFDGKPSNVDSAIPKVKVTLNNPEDQRQIWVAPDPVKLVNAVPCDWKIPSLKANVTQRIESAPYWGVLDNRKPWLDPVTNEHYRGGGTRDSNFEFAYSEKDKEITSTVRVMLIPMDLFPVDQKGVRDTSVPADKATIPYEFHAHSKMAPGSIDKGIKMDYRDAVGTDYNVTALSKRIETVLNQPRYKLILDGCSKGAACGCRVKVNFKVELRVSIRGAPVDRFKPHVWVKLFPFVLRADTGTWGEGYKWEDKSKETHDYPDAHVEAHECGHYFNFPDEYYDQGGWLHKSYIKNEQIDFSLVDEEVGKLVWQGRSQSNLMGYGAGIPLDNGRPTISPYYLEYVRRQFSLATNKLWRIGYES